MNIVLEGPDHAGKSTLAARLGNVLNLPVVQGEGPPKSPEEFKARVEKYLATDGVIFDRHPCISDQIYAPAMGRITLLRPAQMRDFYASRPFIIYVRPTTRELPASHRKHDHESQEHFDRLHAAHGAICQAYDDKMLNCAHYVCRRSDTHLMELAHTGALMTLLNLDHRILA